MRTVISPMYIYTTKNCKTKEEIITALNYYETDRFSIMLPHQRTNFKNITKALYKKLSEYNQEESEHLLLEFENKDRLFYYYKSVELSVEFLKQSPNGELLTQLFLCLKEALKISGKEWTKEDYTDTVVWHSAFTTNEKKIQFIYKLLMSGLRKPETIVNVINYYIKLVNTLQIRDLLSVDLPSRKDVHNLSFAISDFKY